AQCLQADGTFCKSIGNALVDGCLTGMATPYQVVRIDSAEMQATIARIETDLHAPGIGVHRYLGDSYYGGGAWILLAAWLGWHYVEYGDKNTARGILRAIERHADPNGDLPEQIVPPILADASYYDYWVRVRGPIASPLLWSHAMCLILSKACGD